MKRCHGRVLITAGLLVLLFAVSTVAAPVEIELWGWLPGDATGNVLAEIVDEFNTSQNEVHVTVSQAQGGFDKWLVAYAAGVAPDVAFNVAEMAAAIGGDNGSLLPLDAFIDGPNGFPRNAFVDDMWNLATVNGKTYHIAIESNERGLFVNTELAAKAGLDTRSANPIRDWNDLLQWAKKMTVRTGDQTTQWGYNANLPLGGDKWHWVWLNDGGLISRDATEILYDSPNAIEAVQFAADLIYNYQVAPPSHSGGHSNQFISGQYAMIIQNSNLNATLAARGITDYITIPGPVGVGKQGGRFSGASASAIGISRMSKNPEAAWRFVKWVTYERGLKFAEARGGIPYLVRGLRSEKFQTQPWSAFAIQISNFRPEWIPYGVPGSAWSEEFNKAWTAVIRGEKPAATALAEAAATSRARLAEYNATKR